MLLNNLNHTVTQNRPINHGFIKHVTIKKGLIKKCITGRAFNLFKIALLTCITLLCNVTNAAPAVYSVSSNSQLVTKEGATPELIYFNQQHLAFVKKQIKAKHPYFTKNYQALIKEADALLTMDANPVTNKTMIPPSGDLHDYISYAPYRWPDPSKADVKPWHARDGIINPVSRDGNTDYTRLKTFLLSTHTLTFAYYFSDDEKYANKVLSLLTIWFLDENTRVNPNVNFGQAVPGVTDGRHAGLIDWEYYTHIITSLQILEQQGVLPKQTKVGMVAWTEAYLDWLVTSKIGRAADALHQNHANSYDQQVIGISLYLKKTAAAKARLAAVKHNRIATQIEPDGKQPFELGRTKSVHYSIRNLWHLLQTAMMGQKSGVDLWDFETADGRSLQKALLFLQPFVLGEQEWTYKQITEGGAKQYIEKYLKPFFSKASTVLQQNFTGENKTMHENLSPLESLQYPPLEFLNAK